MLKERKKQANKNNISSKETIKKIDEIIDLNSKIFFRKSRPEHECLIGEVDASKGYWFGTRQSHLHALYEHATKKILALHLEKEETTKGYYEILKQAIKNNTAPRLLKGDCWSNFVINKKQAGTLANKDVNTQFGFVLKNTLYSLFYLKNNRVSFKEKSAILILETIDRKTKSFYMNEELIMKKNRL